MFMVYKVLMDFSLPTNPDITDIMKPLEAKIHQRLLPNIRDQLTFNQTVRNLVILPSYLGALAYCETSC